MPINMSTKLSDLSPLTRRNVLLGIGAAASLPACETLDPNVLNQILTTGGTGFGLSQADADLGIRTALNNGVSNAIGTIGVFDGFWKNNLIQIPLPSQMVSIQNTLSRFGAGSVFSRMHEQLNRGAEKAVPVAKDIFVGAVSQMSIQDALNIVRGPETAATDFLKGATQTQLVSSFSPIMETALSNTGALQLVSQVEQSVANIPFQTPLTGARGNLISHGVSKGLDGMFYYIGEEEKAIRANPVKRTSEILRRVFGTTV